MEELTVDQLKEFDGKSPSGKIYVAVNGKVFDVTTKGMHFYGPGGDYEFFAGRDASRGVATMSKAVSDKYDDLHDLTEVEKQKLEHWERQFIEKYEQVGVLKKS